MLRRIGFSRVAQSVFQQDIDVDVAARRKYSLYFDGFK
jgi:hypothetical protein